MMELKVNVPQIREFLNQIIQACQPKVEMSYFYQVRNVRFMFSWFVAAFCNYVEMVSSKDDY